MRDGSSIEGLDGEGSELPCAHYIKLHSLRSHRILGGIIVTGFKRLHWPILQGFMYVADLEGSSMTESRWEVQRLQSVTLSGHLQEELSIGFFYCVPLFKEYRSAATEVCLYSLNTQFLAFPHMSPCKLCVCWWCYLPCWLCWEFLKTIRGRRGPIASLH